MSKKPIEPDPLRTQAEMQLARTPKKGGTTRSAEETLHELQVYQIELETQNEELRQAQVELEKSRDRYVDFYDFSPVGYITLNQEGMIDEINLTGAKLLGMERSKLVHRHFFSFVATEDRYRWHVHFLSVLNHDDTKDCELMLRRNDESSFFALLHCLLLKNNAKELSVRVVMGDISERVRAELAVRESMKELAFQNEEKSKRAAELVIANTERDRMTDAHVRDVERLQKSLEQSIQAIADTVEARDPYTAGHQSRVSILAAAIAQELGLTEEVIHGIRLAATIHDLGKVQVPAEILVKPGKLNDLEFMLMKTHPQAGYDILKDVDFPWPIATMVYQHHERLDGSGYPLGLKGEAILLESRIMAVADVVEAMVSYRPYRPALGIDAALAEIERGRGSAFDSAAVDACLKLFREGRFAFKAETGRGKQ